MKKSNFIALIMGTISMVLFALGMCMALLPEWNTFKEGVVFGIVGIVLGVITYIVWCKMANKKMPKLNGRTIFRTTYVIIASLVFGTGMCMCMVFEQFVWGTIVGLIGIIMLLALIPMIKGLK